ncbi:MAG: hypothetical protein K2X81_21835, partial [Candidatus Obscuribacterales bacterium]|nr:hypothetical protein [Candidatus Obscuribacterales bacterium]
GLDKDGWKRTRVYALPGSEELASKQVNIVEITARVENEPLLSNVTVPLEAALLRLRYVPQAKLKLNAKDSVQIIAEVIETTANRYDAVQVQQFLKSLQLTFDPASQAFLLQSNSVVSGRQASWVLTSKSNQSGIAPDHAQLKVEGKLGKSSVICQGLIELQVDDAQLEFFCNGKSELLPGDDTGIWYYAKVKDRPADPGFNAAESTAKIEFDFEGAHSDLLSLHDIGMSGPYKTVRVIASEPDSGALPSNSEPSIVAKVKVGNEELRENLKISFDQSLKMRTTVKGSYEATVHPEKPLNEWKFPPIEIYFHHPGQSAPVKTEFKFKEPAITVDPPVLKIKNKKITETKSYLQLELDKTKVAEFEKVLAGLGQIHVKVRAESLDGRKSYEGSIYYRLANDYEIVIEQLDGDRVLEKSRPANSPDKTGYGFYIDPWELLCDGNDQLKLRVYLALPTPAGAERKPVATATVKSIVLKGFEQENFSLTLDAGMMNSPTRKAGEYYYSVKSKKPLLLNEKRVVNSLKLELSIEDSPYTKTVHRLEQIIVPRYFFLKLWVYPGLIRDLSYASACLFFDNRRDKPIPTGKLELKVESPANGPSLQINDKSLCELSNHGWAMWTISYKGLAWNNVDRASFVLKCRMEGADECAVFYVDVAENGRKFLAALQDAAAIKDETQLDYVGVNNPVWEDPNSWCYMGDKLIPRDCRGPVYNLLQWVFDEPTIKTWAGHYLCSNMEYRIFRFALRRRFNPKYACDSNGIEYSAYAIGDVHTFFGLSLSGTRQFDQSMPSPPSELTVMFDNVWFIDPWWRQAWESESVMLSWSDEYRKYFATITFLACELALVILFMEALSRVLLRFFGLPLEGVGFSRQGLKDAIKKLYMFGRNIYQTKRSGLEQKLWRVDTAIFNIECIVPRARIDALCMDDNRNYIVSGYNEAKSGRYVEYLQGKLLDEFAGVGNDLPTPDTEDQGAGKKKILIW